MGATGVGSTPPLSVPLGRGERSDTRNPRTRGQAPWVTAAVGRWLPGLIAGVAITVIVWGLMLPLTSPLRGDELTSLVAYSARGPGAIWGTYVRNDHILYELLTWALRGATGDHTAAVVRFWSVIPATAAVLLLTAWLWRRLDPWVAAVFAVLMAAAPAFMDLAAEGRGYGLTFLAVAVMLIGADLAARGRARGAVALFAAGAIGGIWTLPLVALVFVAMAALLLAKLGPRRDLCLGLAGVGVASLAWYAPLLGSLVTNVSGGDGQTLSPVGFVTRPLRDLLQPSVLTLTHPVTSTVAARYLASLLSFHVVPLQFGAALIGGVAVVVGVIVLLRQVERFLAAALVLPVIFTYLVLEVARSHVISRFACYLLPGLLIAVAAGLVGVGRLAARTRPSGLLMVAAAVVLCLWVIGKAYRLDTFDAGRTGAVVSNQPSAFAGYLSPTDVSRVTAPELHEMACDEPGSFMLLYYEDHPQPVQTAACLKQRDAFGLVAVRLKSGQRSVTGQLVSVPALRSPRPPRKGASIPPRS